MWDIILELSIFCIEKADMGPGVFRYYGSCFCLFLCAQTSTLILLNLSLQLHNDIAKEEESKNRSSGRGGGSSSRSGGGTGSSSSTSMRPGSSDARVSGNAR